MHYHVKITRQLNANHASAHLSLVESALADLFNQYDKNQKMEIPSTHHHECAPFLNLM